jgi:hypothetical protein
MIRKREHPKIEVHDKVKWKMFFLTLPKLPTLCVTKHYVTVYIRTPYERVILSVVLYGCG